MEKFILAIPTIEHKDQAIDYIKEHYKYHSNINGVGGLNRFLNDYTGWLKKLGDDRNQITNEERVPAETFFLTRLSDNKIIGMINIRLDLNERQRTSGGHIGYGIRPSERQKGYNKINLFLGLLKCQEHGLKMVMLDCEKENLGSSKTIQALCGKLEKEYYDGQEHHCIVQKYWINVDEAIERKRAEFQQYILS